MIYISGIFGGIAVSLAEYQHYTVEASGSKRTAQGHVLP